jgi:alkylation response protein AidB-like acyl-CoA dehydrogenase
VLGVFALELDLSSDQELLRDSTVRFIAERCPISVVREAVNSDTGIPAGYLHSVAELGFFSLLVPDMSGHDGLAGEGLRDLAIIAEERGRGLQPAPFIPMNVVASALVRGGSDEQKKEVLEGLSSGDCVATWAIADDSAASQSGAFVSITDNGDGFTLSGDAGLVQDGALSDWILVTAGASEVRRQFLLPSDQPGLRINSVKAHDVTQRFSRVTLNDVRADSSTLVGSSSGTVADDVEYQIQIATILSVAETVGAMDALFEMTRQYALDRTAFGRPIGSYQAVKHQMSDMSLLLEASKAISAAATQAVQAEDADASEIISMAKSWVGDSGIDLAQGCFQVFGGIGYTWEHDMHLFLRRITMNALQFGQPDAHRERICRLNGL